MKLKITQEFFYEIDPEWYEGLDSDKSLAEKIIEFEKREVEQDIIAWDNLEKGQTLIEIVEE
jgi:hypothetical protein